MKELITRPQADLLFTVAPLVAAVAALAWWRLRKSPTGLAFAVGALLLGVLWRVFNAISERIGIETVANLLVNAAVFVMAGVGYGLWMRRFVPASNEPIETPWIGFLSPERNPLGIDAPVAPLGNAPADAVGAVDVHSAAADSDHHETRESGPESGSPDGQRTEVGDASAPSDVAAVDGDLAS